MSEITYIVLNLDRGGREVEVNVQRQKAVCDIASFMAFICKREII